MSKPVILCIDVGGTKLDYSFVELGSIQHPILAGRLFCKDFSRFDKALKYLFEQVSIPVFHVCIAAAGPVQNNCISFTNLDWHIDASAIVGKFRLKKIILVNDLTAVTWSLQTLAGHDYLPIKTGKPHGNTSLVVAPGTGLGVGIGVQTETEFVCLPSEGGHVSFSPRTQLEFDLLQFLRQEGGHISAESVCSGLGLGSLFNFLSQGNPCDENVDCRALGPWLQLQIENKTQFSGVVLETYNLFFDILAEVCGNLAVTCLPNNGIFLTGGLMGKIGNYMNQERFIERFLDRSVQKELLRSMPILHITHENSAIVGCHNLMMMKMKA